MTLRIRQRQGDIDLEPQVKKQDRYEVEIRKINLKQTVSVVRHIGRALAPAPTPYYYPRSSTRPI